MVGNLMVNRFQKISDNAYQNHWYVLAFAMKWTLFPGSFRSVLVSLITRNCFDSLCVLIYDRGDI